MNLQGKKINFLGDSITQGCRTSGFEHCFTEVMARDYGIISRNYGIGGTRIAKQQGVENDGNYCDRMNDMDPDADVIVVFGGTNDFGHGNAPIGTFEDRTYDTFYGAMHVLCRGLIEKYPHADIMFVTPLHRLNEDNPHGDGYKTDFHSPLIDYINIIREVTAYYSLPVLDLFAAGQMQPKVDIQKELYMPDGLHPNDAGHLILARRIARFLETTF